MDLKQLSSRMLISINNLQSTNYYSYKLEEESNVKVSNGWVYKIEFNFFESILDKAIIKINLENP